MGGGVGGWVVIQGFEGDWGVFHGMQSPGVEMDLIYLGRAVVCRIWCGYCGIRIRRVAFGL